MQDLEAANGELELQNRNLVDENAQLRRKWRKWSRDKSIVLGLFTLSVRDKLLLGSTARENKLVLK